MTVAVAPVLGSPTPATPVNGAPKPTNGAQAAPGAKTPEVKAAELRFKRALKVNGKEVPVDLDEAGLTRELQVGMHSRQQLEQRDAELKAERAWQQKLSQDPDSALKERGFDLEALIAARTERARLLAELTPEQKRIAELEEREAHRLEQDQRNAETQKQTQAREARERRQGAARGELLGALKHLGYSVDGEANRVHRGQALSVAARLQRMAIKATGAELTAEQLGAAIPKQLLGETARTAALVAQVPEFRQKHAKELSAVVEGFTQGLDGDELLTFMGPALEARFIQAQLAKLERRRGGVPMGGQPAPVTPQNGQQNGHNKSLFEMQRDLRAARGG